MTKEVLVSIAGLHADMNEAENEENEPIEVLSPGTYFFKDNKHYIFLEEVTEGIPGVTKTQIRIHGQDSVEVIKKGALAMHMLFETDKKNRAYYKTPYGELNLGISTHDISVEETEDNINVKARQAKSFSICETMEFSKERNFLICGSSFLYVLIF